MSGPGGMGFRSCGACSCMADFSVIHSMSYLWEQRRCIHVWSVWRAQRCVHTALGRVVRVAAPDPLPCPLVLDDVLTHVSIGNLVNKQLVEEMGQYTARFVDGVLSEEGSYCT